MESYALVACSVCESYPFHAVEFQLDVLAKYAFQGGMMSCEDSTVIIDGSSFEMNTANV